MRSGMHESEKRLLIALAKFVRDNAQASTVELDKAISACEDDERCFFDGNEMPCIEHSSRDGYLAAMTEKDRRNAKRWKEEKQRRNEQR